jgi:hypothetical protein
MSVQQKLAKHEEAAVKVLLRQVGLYMRKLIKLIIFKGFGANINAQHFPLHGDKCSALLPAL